jgi:hypothetical protein
MPTIASSLVGAGQSTVLWYTYTISWILFHECKLVEGKLFYFFGGRYPIQEHCGPNNMCYIEHLGLIMSIEKDCQI